MQLFTVLLVTLISKTAFSVTKTHVVNGHQAGLTCTVYLHIPDSPDPQKPLPIIFHQAGSGIYTRATFSGNYILDFFWKKQKAAILTIDKPGISPDPQDPKKPIVDHSIYDRYVMTDLVACAKNAVYWAFAQKNDVSEDIFLYGHSEGSMIFTRLYADLLQTDPDMDENIRAIVLSGAPLGSMKELFESQSGGEEERKEFWDAYARKDDKYFLESGDTGYAWIEEAVNSAPLNETFKKLADLEPRAKAPLHFLHGIQDEGVSILPVKELEAWNKERKEKKLGSLNMFARYYEAGHFGNNASAIDTIGIMLFHWR